MASIKKRPDGQWRARYRDDAGKEHARHFARKVDAQRWLDEVTALIMTGQYADPRAGKVTVKAYATGWEKAQVGSPATARIIDNALRLHILPALGTHPMASVKRSDVQGLVKGLSATHAPGTVRNVYDVLARVFASAVDDRVIASTPCRKITLPKMDDGEIIPPTPEEVAAMAGEVPARYQAAVWMLAGSGLRIGELLGLRISDVDFLRKTVRVARQRLQVGTLAAPKTPESARTVPLSPVLVEELARHLSAFPSDEWLFCNSKGEPVGYRTWKTVWRNARTRIGSVIDTHDLRHFYATALIAEGASVKQVQTVLGHASPVITLNTYTGHWPGDDERTRSAIDNILRTGCGLGSSSTRSVAGQSG